MARALTLADYRSQCRLWFDGADEEDLPNLLIDEWVQEGFDLAVAPELEWQFYESSITISTAPGVASYTLQGPAGTLHTVFAVRGDRWNLEPVGHFSAQRAFRRDTATAREPNWYSIWGDLIYLWPTPDAAYSIDVEGFRKPNDWVADGPTGVPDAPVELHRPILTWVRSRAYLQQDDLENGQIFENQFGAEMRALRDRFTVDQAGLPLVVNRRPLSHRPRGEERLWYDWE